MVHNVNLVSQLVHFNISCCPERLVLGGELTYCFPPIRVSYCAPSDLLPYLQLCSRLNPRTATHGFLTCCTFTRMCVSQSLISSESHYCPALELVEVRMAEFHDAVSDLRCAIRRWKYYQTFITHTVYGVGQHTRSHHFLTKLAADVKRARSRFQSARDALAQAL